MTNKIGSKTPPLCSWTMTSCNWNVFKSGLFRSKDKCTQQKMVTFDLHIMQEPKQWAVNVSVCNAEEILNVLSCRAKLLQFSISGQKPNFTLFNLKYYCSVSMWLSVPCLVTNQMGMWFWKMVLVVGQIGNHFLHCFSWGFFHKVNMQTSKRKKTKLFLIVLYYKSVSLSFLPSLTFSNASLFIVQTLWQCKKDSWEYRRGLTLK